MRLAIKITETIERSCCQWPKDLKNYNGEKPRSFPQHGNGSKIWFCVHCGQQWHIIRAAGELDGGLEKLTVVEWE